MKRFLSILLALVMVLGIASSLAEEAALELWTIWSNDSESNRAPLMKTLEEFKAAYPDIAFNWTSYDASGYDQILKAAVQSGEGCPDVFYYNAGGIMKPFVEAGKLAAFDDYLTDGTGDRIVEGTLSNMTFDGKVYGMPYTNACSIVFVNPALFEKYGVALPTTWTEFVAACQTFKDNGVTPLALGGKDSWCICMYMDIIMLRQCGYQAMADTFYKREGANFMSEDMIAAAQKLVDLVNMGAFPEGVAGISRDESEVPFYAGEIPMYINGNWTAANCPEGFSCIPFPVIEDGKGAITDFMGGAAEGFMVSATAKNMDAAMTLCKFLAENHSYNAYVVGAGMPTWNFTKEVTGVDPLIGEIVGYTSTATNFLLWGNTILEGEDSTFYGEKLQSMLMGELTAEEFCAEMQTLLP